MSQTACASCLLRWSTEECFVSWWYPKNAWLSFMHLNNFFLGSTFTVPICAKHRCRYHQLKNKSSQKVTGLSVSSHKRTKGPGRSGCQLWKPNENQLGWGGWGLMHRPLELDFESEVWDGDGPDGSCWFDGYWNTGPLVLTANTN